MRKAQVRRFEASSLKAPVWLLLESTAVEIVTAFLIC
jgi:hypothetical protein